jgi:DNA-binding protein HU-beta
VGGAAPGVSMALSGGEEAAVSRADVTVAPTRMAMELGVVSLITVEIRRAMASKPSVATKKTAARTAIAKAPETEAVPVPVSVATQKKVAATVTLKAVFEQLAERHAMPKKQAQALAVEMVDLVTRHLKNGDRVRMPGLGIIEVKDRVARMGRNPGTGEVIHIAASRKVAFRAARELKQGV